MHSSQRQLWRQGRRTNLKCAPTAMELLRISWKLNKKTSRCKVGGGASASVNWHVVA